MVEATLAIPNRADSPRLTERDRSLTLAERTKRDPVSVEGAPDTGGGARGLRLVVLAAGEAPCEATVQGVPLGPPTEAVTAPAFDVPNLPPETRSITASVKDDAGIEAIFLLGIP
jgi:hypothetical protein